MPRNGSIAELIITLLKRVEEGLSQGQTLQEALKTTRMSEQDYFHYRRLYVEMDAMEFMELEDLRKENHRLKVKINDVSLHNTTLRELTSTWPYRIGESLMAMRASTRKMAETYRIERARENIPQDIGLYGIRDADAADAIREMMIAAAEDELAKYASEVEDDN